MAIAVIAGDRLRGRRPPARALIVVSSASTARSLRDAGRSACLALPGALPLRRGALSEIRIERGAAAVDLAGALREAARVLAAAGRLTLVTSLRVGGIGLCRWVLAALLPIHAPLAPERVAREIVLAGFDRIDQELRGSTGFYEARRIPAGGLPD